MTEMRVYQRGVRKFYIDFTEHQGIRRRIPGLTDKKASESLGRMIERLVSSKVGNEGLTVELQRWIETLSPSLRETLGKYGLLEGQKLAGMRTLKDHIDDWQAFLLAKGNTAKHANLVSGRAKSVVDGCKFVYPNDISAARVMAHLHDLRDGERNISAQTSNFYLQAIKQFCRWMCKDGRATSNPLEYLDGLNVRTDRRHDRRALEVEEIRWLLDTTVKQPPIRGMAGPARAILYTLALESGLRAAELASLTRESFNLAADPPTVRVLAGYSKHRREDVLTLRPATAAKLRELLAVTLPNVPIFSMPRHRPMSETLAEDLAAARAKWLAEAATPAERERRDRTDFLVYRDAAGHYCDFHSLRHSCGSLLAAAGVHPKTPQAIMRHSDINLTLSRYSHVYDGQEADALAKLPDFDEDTSAARRAEATG